MKAPLQWDSPGQGEKVNVGVLIVHLSQMETPAFLV